MQWLQAKIQEFRSGMGSGLKMRKLKEITNMLLAKMRTYLAYPLLIVSTMVAILVALHELVIALGNAWVLAKGVWSCVLTCRRSRVFLRGSYCISCVRGQVGTGQGC